MYLRIVTFHVKTEIDYSHVLALQDSIGFMLTRYAGFCGAACGVNSASRQVAVFLLWEDETHAASAGVELVPKLFECLRQAIDAPVEIRGYELLDMRLSASFERVPLGDLAVLLNPSSHQVSVDE